MLGLGLLVGSLVLGIGAASAGTPVPPPAGAIVVGTAGTYCPSPAYSTIQSAVTAASPGATIYVCAGTYAESPTIDKPLVLLGAQYDVDARTRDGSYETVVNGSGGISYSAGATTGTLNGFTVTGYQGSVAAIDAQGTGSSWSFLNDIVDASNGGIALNTDAVANPAPTDVKQDLFQQATPSAAPSGDEGQAVILTGGAANDVRISNDAFVELSGPGAAITTPGTAACGGALDTTNFSENLTISHDTMTENGGSFTDPVNGPGFLDEPFVDLMCTNAAAVEFDTVSVTDAADAHARTAVELTGGDFSPIVEGNALDGDGTTSAAGVSANLSAFPSGTGVQVVDNFVSGYATGIAMSAGSGFAVVHNFVKGSTADGLDVTSTGGGTVTGNAVSGSTTDDCVDTSTGGHTAGTADTWTGNGGATSAPSGLCATFTVPAFTSPRTITANVASSLSAAVTTTGYPAPALSAIGLPPGLSFTDNGNGTGTITGTASALSAGVHQLRIRAANSFRFTYNVVSQNLLLELDRSPGFVTPSSRRIRAGVGVRFLVRAAGYPLPTLTESGGLPPGLTFTDNGNGTATIAGTPTAPLGASSWPLGITARNSLGTVGQSLVLSTSLAPASFTSPLRAAAVVGRSFTDTISATSAYGVPALAETGTLPPGLAFADNHNGTATVVGTVTPGAASAYQFEVSATTAAGTVSVRYTILVESVPVITSATSADEQLGTAFRFFVTATGRPKPTFTESGALPPGVSFVPSGSYAKLTGVPIATGTWTFTLSVSNAVGSNSQTFTMIVY